MSHVYRYFILGGVKTPVTLTAYVMISLLDAGVKKSDSRMQRLLSCLRNNLADVKDAYSLAIISYAFAKVGAVSEYRRTKAHLDKLAIEKGKLC